MENFCKMYTNSINLKKSFQKKDNLVPPEGSQETMEHIFNGL